MLWLLLIAIVAAALVIGFVPRLDPSLKTMLIIICGVLLVVWILLLLGMLPIDFSDDVPRVIDRD